MMRAVQFDRFGDADVLEIREIAVPEPISTEIRVRCVSSSVNPVDVKTRRGSGVARWQGAPPYPLGWDVAGIVDAVGYGVTRFSVGDPVFGMPWFPRPAGAYAQFVTAPSLHFARAPRSVSLTEAAGLPLAALTAWQSIDAAGAVLANTSVLIVGATGGVGPIAAQLAKQRGAHVIAVARRDPVHVRELTDADEVALHVEEIEPASVDVVLDLVGGSLTGLCVRTVRPGGVLLAIADGASQEVREEACRRRVQVVEPLVEPDGRSLDAIARLTDDGVVRIAVDRVFSIEQIQEAHRYLERRDRAVGKVLVAVD